MKANEKYTGVDGNTYSVLAANAADESPAYKGEYAYACNGCYLGYPHSEAKHAADVAKAAR